MNDNCYSICSTFDKFVKSKTYMLFVIMAKRCMTTLSRSIVGLDYLQRQTFMAVKNPWKVLFPFLSAFQQIFKVFLMGCCHLTLKTWGALPPR